MLIAGALACIVVGWAFGTRKLREHLNETSDIRVGAWWDWLIKVIVPAGLLFVVIIGGFMKDIAPEGYEGYFDWSWPIGTILGVTLILSFVLQAVETRGPKEVSEK